MMRSVDMRTPADLEELNLFKGIGSQTNILKKAGEIGALGTVTDDLLEGTAPWPERVSNIRTNDGCSDKNKVAMQMGVGLEDLFVERPLPPRSGKVKTVAGLNEPAPASACNASTTKNLTAQTNSNDNTDAMLGASSMIVIQHPRALLSFVLLTYIAIIQTCNVCLCCGHAQGDATFTISPPTCN